MNSSEHNRPVRPSPLTTWTIGNRRYYSPIVHALDGRVAPAADATPRTRPNLAPRRREDPARGPAGRLPAPGERDQDPAP